MLLTCTNLTKSFGDRTLFSELSFNLDKNERLAIVGRNGCGKSTLLKIINGLEEYDAGDIKQSDIKISYLSQHLNEEEDTRSGGEKTRAELERIFEEKPSLMLLDEPTNHLDMQGIDWLEEKISSYRGALILVSHDRYLIDKVATKVLDLNTRPYRLYKGNYSAYISQKEIIVKTNERSNKKLADKIRHEQAVIDKLKQFNREKSIKRAESREKMLAKLDGPTEFIDESTKINMVLKPGIESGKDVLFLSGIEKTFGDRCLFKDVNIDVRRGEHIGLIGGNGTGKTTLFNIILGREKQDDGDVKVGTNVYVSYYDQKLNLLDDNKNVYDEISDEYRGMTETEVRNTLAAFSFYGDDVYKRIESLSGGERGRLTLCKLMLSDANLLLLDEPTNHLDMESRETLEDAINHYTGTVVFISHDRFFLNKCADRILELDSNSIKNYLGNYDEYVIKKQDLIDRGILKEDSKEEIKTPKEYSDARLSWEEEKRQKQAEEKRARDEKKTIEEIEKVEEEISNIEIEEANPEYSSDFVKLRELMEHKEALTEKLNELYDKLDNLI